MLEISRGEVEILRRITAQRQNVLDPGIAIPRRDIDEFSALLKK